MTGPLMIDLEGTRPTDTELERLERKGVGGVILFARNYESPAQLRTLVESLRRKKPKLLIAVDQEGGRVQRFRDGFTRIPSMSAIGRLYDRDPERGRAIARAASWLMASELCDFGLDFSFAPVLDLDYGESAVIGDRSFHQDPKVVSELAGAWVRGMNEAGMPAVGKHFPGHGAVTADSHHALPEDGRAVDTIMATDVLPFRELAAQGLEAVMPAHVVYSRADSSPAGFSTFWLRDVLRGELEFDGVIFSDDLTMEGAAGAGSYPERAKAALDAGCDMLLVCNDAAASDEVLDWLETQSIKPSPRLSGMRAKPLPGPRGAFRSTARYRDTRAAILQMVDDEERS